MSAIHSFLLAMSCFPEVQIKAQAELDRVVSGRLPDFSDMEGLPYLSAVIKEVLRSVLDYGDEKKPIIIFLSFTQMATNLTVWFVYKLTDFFFSII